MFGGKQPINIVTDCDEVLTDISPLWVSKIHEEREFFKKYFYLNELFDHMGVEDYKKVLSRPEFHINKWMRKKDLTLSENEEKELFDKFYSLYDNDDFYRECIPTKMAEGIYKLSLQRYVNKIYIVTRTSDGTRESKRKWLETHLSGSKFEIIFVGRDEKKSDYIKKLDNVKMIVEDELSNIHDIVDNCDNLHEVDLYIPSTGYNLPDHEFFEKMKENHIKPLYYPIF
jgi:phosphoglycolate phosphatase-like HAD superfamily hydrolase